MQLVGEGLALGIAAFFLIEVIRRLPWIAEATLRGVKPFACHTCMALWTAGLVVAVNSEIQAGHARFSCLWPLWPIVGGVALALLYFTDAAAASSTPELPS